MWCKLDHGFFRNPKTLTVGAEARLLYLAAVCYAGDRLTDGLVPDDALPLVAAEAQVVDAAAAVARLVAAGLWHAVAGGYRIHDFFDWNASAKKIKARREASRARAAARRAARKAVQQIASSGEVGTRGRTAHAPQTNARHDADALRTNRVRDSDSDSDSDGLPSPPPPAPAAPVSVQGAERESGLRAVPKPHELERAQLEAHPLYQPLVEQFGRPTARDVSAWRDDLATLDSLGAIPDDIPIAAAAYERVMGTDATGRSILLTRHALVVHWKRCMAPLPPPTRAPGDFRMPIHGELDDAKYTGSGVYARQQRPYDDDISLDELEREMGIRHGDSAPAQAATP